jgi:hypothetical protein
LRRCAARRACWRFLMTLLSGSAPMVVALAAFAGGFASMATVGASSAAILAAARSGSGKAGALVCSDAIGAASFAGGEASSIVANFVSAALASA